MTPLVPQRTAMVAVHLQNDFVAADGDLAKLFRPEAERCRVLPNAARIIGAARAAGVKVAYTRIAFQPGHTDLVANSPLLRMVQENNLHVEGTPGPNIIDDVKPEAGDIIVSHQRLSGFQGTQLDNLLRGFGIDTVVFFGVATNVSVEGSARAASDLGYRTIVVADACSTTTEAAHKAALESLAVLAEIVTTDELLATIGLHTAGGNV